MKRRIRHSPAVWIIIVCAAASLAGLVLYLLYSGDNDTVLFLLLAVLRYSSFFLCICSLYRLMLCIYRVFRRFSAPLLMHIFMYIGLIVYGVSVFLYAAFTNVVAGGNG